MEEKKVLSIDTMICDLRTVSEETLQSYEKINISAMTVFVTERTQELFHRYPVNLDAMAVEKLDENVRLVEQNGVYKINRIAMEKLLCPFRNEHCHCGNIDFFIGLQRFLRNRSQIADHRIDCQYFFFFHFRFPFSSLDFRIIFLQPSARI